MKKTLFAALALVLLVGVAIVLPLSTVHAVESFAIETELRQYDKTLSYGGYVLFDPSANPTGYSATPTHVAYLMDMEGYIYHIWKNTSYTPRFLPDGTLWTQGQIQDWDGNILWQLDPATNMNPKDADMMPHHDGYRFWNKKLKAWTYILLNSRPVTNAQIWAAGGDPSIDYVAKGRNKAIDGIIEIDQNYNVLWEWNYIDHTCQSKNSTWPQYVSDTKLAPGKMDIHWRTDANQPGGNEGIDNDWLHCNSIDYNEDLDHIVINAKNMSELHVIDHGKTFVSATGNPAVDRPLNIAAAKSSLGDFIYRWGNPSLYNSGTKPSYQSDGHQQMYGSHNIQWINNYQWEKPHLATDKWSDPASTSGTALPGAGNFLIFDNGCWRPTGTRSKIIEWNAFYNANKVNTGAYVPEATAGWTADSGGTTLPAGFVMPAGMSMPTSSTKPAFYKSNQTVWTYTSSTQHSFYSSHISSAQRLPNGNTSICSGNQGHWFEVTSAGKVVWEYLLPIVSSMVSTTSSTQTVQKDGGDSQAYRHYRYGAAHPALAGKTLTSMGTLTGRNPSTVGSNFTYPTAVTYTGFGLGSTGTTSGGGSGGASAGGGGGGGY
jgi:hypothetical protein